MDLNHKPSYQSISYVWGNSDRSKYHMTAEDGSRIPLTESLHNALRDLRSLYKTLPSTFWADGICINQDDIVERNQQVQIMGRIYRDASRVITYIGPASSDDYRSLNLARDVSNYYTIHQDEVPDPRLRVRALHSQLSFPDHKDPRWEALRHLVHRPWSSRVWMMQEFLLNDTVLMLCGRETIPWKLFLQMPRLGVDGEIPGAGIVGTLGETTRSDNLSVLEVLRTARDEHGGLDLTLLQLLQLGRVMASTDPRDKVYALLGLACDRDKLEFVPNYNSCTAEVYRKAAVCILKTSTHLDIFSSCTIAKSIELPSWVPNWFSWSDDTPAPLVCDATVSGLRFYDACAGTTSEIGFNTDDTILTAKGASLDRISFSSGRLEGSRYHSTDPVRNFFAFQELLVTAVGLQMSRPGAGAIEVFWRTLIANIVSEQHQADSRVGEWFSAYMKLMKFNFDFVKGLSSSRLTDSDMDQAAKYLCNMFAKAERRSLCTTEKGYLCLAPPDACAGDIVSIFLGGCVPYVLRQIGDAYVLIGDAYVHGLMNGEAFGTQILSDSIRDFKLV